VQRLLVGVARLKRGASADVDGDGAPDLLASAPGDGSRLLTSPADTAGHSSFWSRLGPAGDETTRIDLDLDGVAEEEVRFTAGPPPVRVIETDSAAKELPEVAVCKFSGGASWEFENRKSLPLTVV